MNKSYCIKLFSEIFSDSASKYRFCCHANENDTTKKYNPLNTTPFDYFLSPEMEQIRNDVLSGKRVQGCEECYVKEDAGHESFREQYNQGKDLPTNVESYNVDLKMHIFGTFCNLGCYMCIPFDSSTRRAELQKSGLKDFWYDMDSADYTLEGPRNLGTKRYEEIEANLIANIDYIRILRFYGGEPIQMPRVWSLLSKIPKDKARNIEVLISTNLTQTEFKGYSIEWIKERFKKLTLTVSVDHYGRKLHWIRYPINVFEFEKNLALYKKDVNYLNIAISILNVYDLKDIERHYNMPMEWGIVVNPYTLSIRHIPDKERVKYIPTKEMEEELFKEADNDMYVKGMEYVKRLEAHRGLKYGD